MALRKIVVNFDNGTSSAEKINKNFEDIDASFLNVSNDLGRKLEKENIKAGANIFIRYVNGDVFIDNPSGTTGILPIANGGTGANTVQGARANLGLGLCSVMNIIPVQNGGTSATTAAQARANLGITPANIGAMVEKPIGIEINNNPNSFHPSIGGSIDFHFGGSQEDFTTRLVEFEKGRLACTGYFVSENEPNIGIALSRQIYAGTAAMIPGVTSLVSGRIYLQIE